MQQHSRLASLLLSTCLRQQPTRAPMASARRHLLELALERRVPAVRGRLSKALKARMPSGRSRLGRGCSAWRRSGERHRLLMPLLRRLPDCQWQTKVTRLQRW